MEYFAVIFYSILTNQLRREGLKDDNKQEISLLPLRWKFQIWLKKKVNKKHFPCKCRLGHAWVPAKALDILQICLGAKSFRHYLSYWIHGLWLCHENAEGRSTEWVSFTISHRISAYLPKLQVFYKASGLLFLVFLVHFPMVILKNLMNYSLFSFSFWLS